MSKKDEGQKKMKRTETDLYRDVVTENHRTKRVSGKPRKRKFFNITRPFVVFGTRRG